MQNPQHTCQKYENEYMHVVYSSHIIKDVTCIMLLIIRIHTPWVYDNYLVLLCRVKYNNLKVIVAQSSQC